MPRFLWDPVVYCALLLFSLPLKAEPMDGIETGLNLIGDCQLAKIYDRESTAEWLCEGYQDIQVWVSGGQERFYVSFGAAADEEPAAFQTLEPRNQPGERVEWVLEDGQPVATILRWFTQVQEGLKRTSIYRGEVLVVTQLGEGQTCHIGYIDALATQNPYELARDTARLLAGIWDCQQAPKLLGRGGRSLGF